MIFVFLKVFFFCSVVAICDLVHNVETIFLQFAVYQASPIFQKRFLDALSS